MNLISYGQDYLKVLHDLLKVAWRHVVPGHGLVVVQTSLEGFNVRSFKGSTDRNLPELLP